MSPSSWTVNGLMLWLEQRFSLRLTVLPQPGWPQWLQDLWNIAFPWVPPSPCVPPFDVPVGEKWIMPLGGGHQMTLFIGKISVTPAKSGRGSTPHSSSL